MARSFASLIANDKATVANNKVSTMALQEEFSNAALELTEHLIDGEELFSAYSRVVAGIELAKTDGLSRGVIHLIDPSGSIAERFPSCSVESFGPSPQRGTQNQLALEELNIAEEGIKDTILDWITKIGEMLSNFSKKYLTFSGRRLSTLESLLKQYAEARKKTNFASDEKLKSTKVNVPTPENLGKLLATCMGTIHTEDDPVSVLPDALFETKEQSLHEMGIGQGKVLNSTLMGDLRKVQATVSKVFDEAAKAQKAALSEAKKKEGAFKFEAEKAKTKLTTIVNNSKRYSRAAATLQDSYIKILRAYLSTGVKETAKKTK